MDKSIFYTVIGVVVMAGIVSCRNDKPVPDFTPKMTDEVRLKTTPVKDQGHSSLCWAYAMLATIETEHLMKGDSVNLSPDYVARIVLTTEARRKFLGGDNYIPTLRGTAPKLIRIIMEHGIMPYDSYNSGNANMEALLRKADILAQRQQDMRTLDTRMNEMLDDAIGALPQRVYMLGAEYTSKEFALSVCMKDEYDAMTSFSSYPFGEYVTLDIPDNNTGERFMNVSIDSLMNRITNELLSGHPVCWEGDISEPGFSFKNGTATLPHGKPCTQEERQRQYELRRTTDDHCMELIGIAHDDSGRRYFIAKNSWGTGNRFGGMMYLADDYVRMKTVAIVVKSRY